jgi:propanol-preferring alcohol dehydrogenase
VKEVQEVTGGQGADATLNVSDHESAAALAVAIAKIHGTMIQIAQPENVSVPFAELVFRDIRIHGSLVGKVLLYVPFLPAKPRNGADMK